MRDEILMDFFFQAEDGIRDKLVTGVQTCALPISQEGEGRRKLHGVHHAEAGASGQGQLEGGVRVGGVEAADVAPPEQGAAEGGPQVRRGYEEDRARVGPAVPGALPYVMIERLPDLCRHASLPRHPARARRVPCLAAARTPASAAS